MQRRAIDLRDNIVRFVRNEITKAIYKYVGNDKQNTKRTTEQFRRMEHIDVNTFHLFFCLTIYHGRNSS